MMVEMLTVLMDVIEDVEYLQAGYAECVDVSWLEVTENVNCMHIVCT